MEWISIEDRLPEIPEGQYGVSVLVAQFDPVYEEICPGRGCSVQEMVYSVIAEKDRERWHYPQELIGCRCRSHLLKKRESVEIILSKTDSVYL